MADRNLSQDDCYGSASNECSPGIAGNSLSATPRRPAPRRSGPPALPSGPRDLIGHRLAAFPIYRDQGFTRVAASGIAGQWHHDNPPQIPVRRVGLDHRSGQRSPPGVQGFSLGPVHPRLKPCPARGGRNDDQGRRVVTHDHSRARLANFSPDGRIELDPPHFTALHPGKRSSQAISRKAHTQIASFGGDIESVRGEL